MPATYRVGIEPGDRVCVSATREHGEVVKVRQDARGVPVIDVMLDSGKSQTCRGYEITVVVG